MRTFDAVSPINGYFFPVLYSDVTKAWRLAPYQRSIVDLGGLYFQAIALPFVIK